MKILKEFICDNCNQIIESPKDGIVSYVFIEGFEGTSDRQHRIIHKASNSTCITEDNVKNDPYIQKTKELKDILSTEFNLAVILERIESKLSQGPDEGQSAAEVLEYIEFIRRVKIPYYEEARKYFKNAINDEYFFEIKGSLYTSENLKRLIDKYSIIRID